MQHNFSVTWEKTLKICTLFRIREMGIKWTTQSSQFLLISIHSTMVYTFKSRYSEVLVSGYSFLFPIWERLSANFVKDSKKYFWLPYCWVSWFLYLQIMQFIFLAWDLLHAMTKPSKTGKIWITITYLFPISNQFVFTKNEFRFFFV